VPDLERLTFPIKLVLPFRLELTGRALRRRAIDRADACTARRI
jgi:hypothetical protein